jgi:hypothetical protein
MASSITHVGVFGLGRDIRVEAVIAQAYNPDYTVRTVEITLDEFYAYVRYVNGSGEAAPAISGLNLMARIAEGDRPAYETYAKWWFSERRGEAGLGLGAYGDSICWEKSNRAEVSDV